MGDHNGSIGTMATKKLTDLLCDHNGSLGTMATKQHYLVLFCDRNGSVGTMASKQYYLADLFCDRNGSVGTMASKQYYLADLFCDRNGSVRSNMANRSEQTMFFFTPSTTDTHNTCAERGRARSGYHILKKFKAFLASSFVRGVLRSTTASVYKLFIRCFHGFRFPNGGFFIG